MIRILLLAIVLSMCNCDNSRQGGDIETKIITVRIGYMTYYKLDILSEICFVYKYETGLAVIPEKDCMKLIQRYHKMEAYDD